MKIASAQIESTVGDIEGNLRKHLDLIALAAKDSVRLIVFPEMSLTGYCTAKGRELVLQPTSPALLKLKEQAKKNDLIIVVGAPIILKEKLFIGSFILLPSGTLEIYTKQFLHPGEEEFYCNSFDYNPSIKIENELISFAICADIDHEEHPKKAKERLSTLYIPSIFFTKKGINQGYKLLTKYAKTYSLTILMSNYSGEVAGMEAGGRSAFWNQNGEVIGALNSKEESLLIIEKQGDHWTKIKS